MNSITGSTFLPLVCHPRTSSQAAGAIKVAVGGAAGDRLTLDFILEDGLSGLRIPEFRSSRRAGKLWQHTCFEIFVMAGDGPGYREFNFSPSGEWAAYVFRSYRDGGELDVEPGPEIRVHLTGERLQLNAQLRRDLLPSGHPLRIGLAAVVEDIDGMLSYWALRHPPGKPDFHHADAFALQLALP